jgi:DNA-directed RNA polymerase alpha subunit
MTKEELLDHFATHAMAAQIEKMGITNPYALAQTAYRMAKEMIDHRGFILREWQAEQERQEEYENSDIKDLDLPIRYERCLTAESIWTKRKLCEWTERDIRRIPNFGERGRQLLKQAMAEHGLKFKGQA